MSPRNLLRVAVVGAGPTGLLTAHLLQRAGFDVTLYGQTQTADEHRRTVALLEGSVALLRDAGAWDVVAPHATPLEVMRLVDDTGRLFSAPSVTFAASEMGDAAFGYNVAASDLSAALAERYAGDRVAEPVAAVGTGEQVTVHAGGDRRRFDIVVGADGRGSIVRRDAGIGVRSWSYDQAALVTVLDHEFDHDETSTEFHRRVGPFVLVPMAGRRSSVVYCDRPDAIERLASAPAEDVVRALGDDCHWLLGEMSLAAPPQVYPLSSFIAKAFAKGPIALVGEAAHGFPPIGAQGLNLGFRDVKALVAALSKDPSPAGLARYDAARRPDILSRTAGVDLLNRSLLTDMLPVQAARAIGLSAARGSRLVRRLMMREGMRPVLAR